MMANLGQAQCLLGSTLLFLGIILRNSYSAPLQSRQSPHHLQTV